MGTSPDKAEIARAVLEERARCMALITAELRSWERVQLETAPACDVNVLHVMDSLRQLRRRMKED